MSKPTLIARLREFDTVPICEEAAARIAELEAQLPDGMKECTILFKECEKGHGRLIAANWIDHGCHWCRLAELEAERDKLKAALDGLADLWPAAPTSFGTNAAWKDGFAEGLKAFRASIRRTIDETVRTALSDPSGE